VLAAMFPVLISLGRPTGLPPAVGCVKSGCAAPLAISLIGCA
jgi:hypothetical protein